MGETRLERSAPAHRRVRVILKPLPHRPPPARDELLSSWIARLARANHCSVEELCGYIGLRQGKVPECAGDLGHVNWARLRAAVQRTPDVITAMTLPDTTHLPVQCISRDDFQICKSCTDQTPGLILRHWRFAWSLTCETCGRPLVARHPADGISDRLRVRAARGAETLRTAVAATDLRRMRRISLTLCLLKILGSVYTVPLTSRFQLERSAVLAAVDVCSTRPFLGLAMLLRGNEQAYWEVRRAFPQHRRLIERVRKLSRGLDRRLPRKRWQENDPVDRPDRATSPRKASAQALYAARQAISELGPDADRQALLARADAIWKRRSCIGL